MTHPPRFSSHIPVAQHSTRPRVASGVIKGLRKKPTPTYETHGHGPTTATRRFDEFSGNLTENGKPAYTSPEAVRLESERRTAAVKLKPLAADTSSTPVPSATKSSDKLQSSRKPWTPEPWKGAGGRWAIVEPMADKPSPHNRKPSFPAGTSRRSMDRINSSPSPDGHIDYVFHAEDSEEPTDLGSHARYSASEEEITRPRPLFSPPPPRTPEQSATFLTNLPTPPQQATTSFREDDTRSPLARNPSNEALKAALPPTNGTLTPVSSRDGIVPDPTQSPKSPSQGPPVVSRFSATTYATTNFESPPSTYESPPATPEMNTDTTPPPSILNRKRPVPVAGLVKSRKPVPSQIGSVSQAEVARRNSKSLPKSPDEAAATTLVASLEAKLDALRRRRQNLKTVLHELTNVVQPSSIAYDIASRAEIKRTVDKINSELAMVQKDEHETGLKLHRAWKRQDQDSVYEPTHLWVRRVTT